MLNGCLSRFCSKNPERKDPNGYRGFIKGWVHDNLGVIPADHDLTIEKYLSETHYPSWRKQDMLLAWEEWRESFLCGFEVVPSEDLESFLDLNRDGIARVRKRLYDCFLLKGFGKVESYGKYKPARGIKSRVDAFKCFFGPFSKAMEHLVYQSPWFIKKVPVKDRGEYLNSRFSGNPGPFYATDYSHFESHFTRETMECAEMQLYFHLMKNFPRQFLIVYSALCGENCIAFKKFTIRVEAVRMSGEMVTSLGNGFTNLMNILYVAHLKGVEVTGVVEGDDALFACSTEVTKDDFTNLGFEIKIEKHSDFRTASFCGIVACSDGTLLTDPRKVLVSFGWSHSQLIGSSEKVKMGLLRAKALSLLYEHPNCPILTALSLRFIVLTNNVKPVWSNNWYEGMLQLEVQRFEEDTRQRVERGVSLEARILFEQLYGINVDSQLKIECDLGKVSIEPITLPSVLELFDLPEYDEARDYHLRFVTHPWLIE